MLAYETGLGLTCFLLEEYSGPDAARCLVPRNPRASWRRLKREFEVEDLSVCVRRMQHWTSCQYEEGADLERCIRKMGILREQVLRSRRDDETPLSDRVCRDILLDNLPRTLLSQLQIERLTTTLEYVENQLRQLHQLAQPVAAPPATDAADAAALVADSEAAGSPPPPIVALNSAEIYGEAVRIWRRSLLPPPMSKPAFRILDLPLELIGAILSHLVPIPSLINNREVETIVAALSTQSERARLRRTCRGFADALGPPADFAIRNLTKARQLINFLLINHGRGARARSRVMCFSDPARGRRRSFVLWDALKVLFLHVPNVRILHVSGDGFKEKDPNDADADDQMVPTKDMIFFDVVGSHLKVVEFSFLNMYGNIPDFIVRRYT